MKVLILGANGKVGSNVAKRLIERGHSVTAAVHSRSNAVPKEATMMTVDIKDPQSLNTALEDCSAVVCALSSWHAPNHDVLTTAMRTVIPAMYARKIRRIVSVSGDVARVPGENTSFTVKLFHALSFGVVKKVVTDSEVHIKMLSESTLDWTVIRPGIMTPFKHRGYTLRQSRPFVPLISRDAVVESIVDLVESEEFIKQSPYITAAKG